MHESEKWKWSLSVVSDPQRPHGLQCTRLLRPWDFPGKSTGVGCHCSIVWYKSNSIDTCAHWGRGCRGQKDRRSDGSTWTPAQRTYCRALASAALGCGLPGHTLCDDRLRALPWPWCDYSSALLSTTTRASVPPLLRGTSPAPEIWETTTAVFPVLMLRLLILPAFGLNERQDLLFT